MRFTRRPLPLLRAALLSLTLIGVLTAVLRPGPDVTSGVWQQGKAAWWDVTWLDLGLTGWGYAPRQPLAFSHKLHAGDYQMDCLYCHSAARVSPVASVPAVQTCMGCHKKATDNTEIQKVQAYWERREPIPWTRIHTLPAFTRFTHKRHVRAGVACQTCHGQVDKMERVQQVSSLKMGWCITCHEARGASKDCLACHY